MGKRIVYTVHGVTTKGKKIPLGGSFKSQRSQTKKMWEGTVYKGKKIAKVMFSNPKSK